MSRCISATGTERVDVGPDRVERDVPDGDALAHVKAGNASIAAIDRQRASPTESCNVGRW